MVHIKKKKKLKKKKERVSSVWESLEGDSAPCLGLGEFTKYTAGKELCGAGLRDICEQASAEGMSSDGTHALGAELRHPTPKEEMNSQRLHARRKGKESPSDDACCGGSVLCHPAELQPRLPEVPSLHVPG